MCAEISEKFVKFARNSSLHVIKYTVLTTTHLLERIFWILILILSLTFACYLTTLFWVRYTSNPTRTTLETTFAPLNTVPFPGVTICNRNKILESKVDAFLNKLEANEQELHVTKNLFSRLVNREFVREQGVLHNITELEIVDGALNNNDYPNMRKIIRRVSQKCEDLIIKCSWNKKPVLCKNIFEESYTADGKCCSFNYVREKSSKLAMRTFYYGLSTGLRVLLKPLGNNKGLNRGVTVIIHNPEDVPGGSQNVKNYLSVGRVNFMQVEGCKQECSQEVKLLTIANRQCLYPDEKKLEYFSKYSDTNCMSVCEAVSIYKLCGCIPYYYDFIDNKPICNVRKLPCLRNITDASCGCLSQCEDEFYDVTVTSSKLVYNPNVLTTSFLDGVNITQNSILLNVFFSTNHQTVWVRNTMTSSLYLISSFGGIYSLFLGCSVITVIEVLYFCFAKGIIKILCCKKNGKKQGKLQKVHFRRRMVSKEMKEQLEYNANPIMPFIN